MHSSVMSWVKAIVDRDGLLAREHVLEVGSYNVNGGVREIFPEHLSTSPTAKKSYVGVDLAAGPGVDFVIADRKFPFSDHDFDLILSTSAFEHDAKFWETCAEMRRVLAPGGVVLLTMAGARPNGVSFPYHGEKHFLDIYRFMEDAMPVLADLLGCKLIEFAQDPQCAGLFLYAEKPR